MINRREVLEQIAALMTALPAPVSPAAQVRDFSRALEPLPEISVALTARTMSEKLGVNVQPNREDRAYSYWKESSYQRLRRHLDFLRIKHVRCWRPDPSSIYYPRAWQSLAEGGFKLTVGIPPRTTYEEMVVDFGPLQRLEQEFPGCIAHVEGANEIQNFYGNPHYTDRNGNFWHPPKAHSVRQDDLYRMVKNDSVLGHCPVVHFTGPPITVEGAADHFCGHPYPKPGPQKIGPTGERTTMPLPGRVWQILEAWVKLGMTGSFTGPIFLTEVGWHSNPKVANGVDEETQAICFLHAWIAACMLPIGLIHAYEAYDGKNSQNAQANFGLFRVVGPDRDLEPKRAALMIRNVNMILNDGSEEFEVSPLRARISGLPQTGRTVLVQKSSGEHLLFFWRTDPVWEYLGDENPSGRQIAVEPAPLALQVENGRTVEWLDPIAIDVPVVEAALAGHPLIARIT